ncbi:hypothetical protein [Kitasatospora sp. LaBMicrA B282]|uniref:hypothetical protein n=1 Tax=Kitasatospora sp. LaBMicrA B282 TaxID=3420949 RepID=UPI003D11A87E
MPRLLPTVPRTPGAARTAPALATLLGCLAFGATIDSRPLPALPDRVFRLPGGARVFHWDRPDAELELLLCRFDPRRTTAQAADDRPLADCWGAVWRVAARRTLERVELSAAFPHPAADVQCDYSGAQSLVAIALWNDRTVLTLGSSDEEELCDRATGRHPDLPHRWGDLLPQVHDRTTTWGTSCDSDARELRWALPALAPREHAVLHSAVAWRHPEPDEVDPEEDLTTFWAVLTSPESVLAAIPGHPGHPG